VRGGHAASDLVVSVGGIRGMMLNGECT